MRSDVQFLLNVFKFINIGEQVNILNEKTFLME